MIINNTQEIYSYFDRIGCLSFSTVNEEGEPEARIAHLRGFDEQGIYFMTMFTKSFYQQLKSSGKIAISGLSAKTEVSHDEKGLPVFERGYAIRMTGDVVEVSIEEIKSKNNPMFDVCIKDQEKYPAMVVFCITAGRGDIFDYDFEMETRENKLERVYITYGGKEVRYSGLVIDQNKCVCCGICEHKCSFKAIQQIQGMYKIDACRCDECGDCLLNCPTKAISTK